MQIPKRHLRFTVVFLVCLVGFVVFIFKLVFIQIFNSSYLSRLADKQHQYFLKLEPLRGAIYDRKLRPLALNVAAYSLYANPRSMTDEDKDRAVRELRRVLRLDEDDLRGRLNREKYFIWLKRKLPRETAEKIKALDLVGISFLKESKRFYPNQTLAAHVIGFAGMDNEGLEGLELSYDHYLEGEYGWSQIIRDAHRTQLLIEKSFIPPKDGLDLVLTVDEAIQYIAERALDEAFVRARAKGAILIILRPRTGEILALANRPSFDLGRFEKSDPESRRDRAVTDMYEPGSVFKIVTAAAALEENKVQETDKFFCENGTYRVGGHLLHDHRPHGILTFREIIEKSSNIGVTKIAQRIGADLVYKYARLFRFGLPTGVNLPGEVRGVLKKPGLWSRTSIGAIPIGHEVLVTAMQLVCAISAIANDGIYMRPFVVKYIKDRRGEVIYDFGPREVSRVVSSQTARRLTSILEGVVERGTGRRARIPGVRVAGKTGTAQKVVNGQYSHSKFYASFIGFAPVEDPQIAMVVVFDEPHPQHYGGTVAAPVFQKVARDVLKYLEVDEKMNPL